MIDAIQQVRDGQREVGVTYDTASLGSGSPQLYYALLRLRGDGWKIVWDSFEKQGWRHSHGRAEFPKGDLSEVIVQSDSWISEGDPSGVLFEANAGPHRNFVDTWVRQGDAYVRTSAETVPAPYATLVRFLYDLSIGNDSDAAAQTTDPAVVEEARGAGLDAAPGKNWLANCNDGGLECGKTEPIHFYSGPPVAISFAERDGNWLISGIQLLLH